LLCTPNKFYLREKNQMSFKTSLFLNLLSDLEGSSQSRMTHCHCVVVKVWPSSRWCHVSQLSRASTKKLTTLRVHPGASTTSNLPEVILHPKDPSILKPHSIILRHLPLRGPFHSEVFPDLKVPTPSLKLQQQIVHDPADTCATSSSRAFITCNTPINAVSYEQWQIPWHAIPPTSSNDYSRYNKPNTWRSCSYIAHQFCPTAGSLSGIFDPSSPKRRGSLS